jgi:hypothetical protein
MRVRAVLLTPVLAALAVAGIGASTASAAGLYTTTAHSTLVPVGTVGSATAGVITLTSGPAPTTINTCSSASLTLSVTTNSGGTVVLDVTAGTFTGCRLPMTANATTHWRITITGDCIPVGTDSLWYGTTISGVSVTFGGGTYTGSLTSGVWARQDTTAKAPVRVELVNAARVAGPLTSDAHLWGSYSLTGTAAAYSLGGGTTCP